MSYWTQRHLYLIYTCIALKALWLWYSMSYVCTQVELLNRTLKIRSHINVLLEMSFLVLLSSQNLSLHKRWFWTGICCPKPLFLVLLCDIDVDREIVSGRTCLNLPGIDMHGRGGRIKLGHAGKTSSRVDSQVSTQHCECIEKSWTVKLVRDISRLLLKMLRESAMPTLLLSSQPSTAKKEKI